VSYRVEIAPAAERQLRRLDATTRSRIADRIRQLADEPRPHGVEKLGDPDDLLRMRAGAYRIVYRVEDDALIVLVVRIGHRREVYRQLARLRGRR
jgi:mRNA interferase RelE/StbE